MLSLIYLEITIYPSRTAFVSFENRDARIQYICFRSFSNVISVTEIQLGVCVAAWEACLTRNKEIRCFF